VNESDLKKGRETMQEKTKMLKASQKGTLIIGHKFNN
jgi:hypothetical protein